MTVASLSAGENGAGDVASSRLAQSSVHQQFRVCCSYTERENLPELNLRHLISVFFFIFYFYLFFIVSLQIFHLMKINDFDVNKIC